MSAPHPHVSFRWAAGDGEYLGVSVQPELIRGQLRCRGLVVTAEDNNEVTSEVLRTIPIGRLTQLAADTLGLGRAAKDALPPKDFAQHGMTEEALRGVVAVYDWCVATGRKPLGVLERDYGMPRGKASRWLARARAGGPPLRRTSAAEHGTLSAYNRCRKRPEGSCEECKAAKREYIDRWKDKRDPGRPKRASRHLTPLPGGGYAEQEWKRLSAHQRKVLEGVARGQPSLLDEVPQYILTIRALIRRGFVDDRNGGLRELTPRGAALFVWAQGRSSTGAA